MEMPIDNAPSIDELVNTILEQSKIIAALEIAVKNLTACNCIKPKMPSLSEVVTNQFLGRFMFEPEPEEYKLVTDTYNYIARHFGH